MKKIFLLFIILMGLFLCVLTASAQTLQDYLNEVTIPSTIYSDMMFRKYSDKMPSNERVSTDSGEMSFQQTDYILPGVNGLDVSIKRIYTTGVLLYQMTAEFDGANITGRVTSDWTSSKFRTFYEERYDMGLGQRFSFPTMEINSTTKYFHSENGGVFRLAVTGGTEEEVIYKPYGSEVDEFEIHERKNFNNTSNYYSYNGSMGYNGQENGRAKYMLIQKDGTKMYFSGKHASNSLTNDEGRLLSIEDRFGNKILFQYKEVSYRIGTRTRSRVLISEITDTIGRKITFDYTCDENYNVPENNYLDGKFQTIVTLPNGQKIVYSKLSIFQISSTNASGQSIMASAREHMYNVSIVNGTSSKVKYSYSREVVPVNFKFASSHVEGVNYSTNIRQIVYGESNRVKNFTYGDGRKHMQKSGSLGYRQVVSEQEVARYANNVEKRLSDKKYNYEGLPTGFGGLAVDLEADSDIATYFNSPAGWERKAPGYASEFSLCSKNTTTSTTSISIKITRQARLTFYRKADGFSTTDVNSVFKVKHGSEVIYESTVRENTDWVKESIDLIEGGYDITFEYTRGTGDTKSYFYLDDIRFDSYSTVSVYDAKEDANPKTITKYVTDNNHQLVQKMVVGNDHYSVDQFTYENQNISSITSTMSTKKDGRFSEISKPSYQTFQYDDYGNLTSHQIEGQIEYQYTYDVNKFHAVKSASVFDLTGSLVFAHKQETVYTNDDLGNATLVRKTGTGVPTSVMEYQYDLKGNLIEQKTYLENDPDNNNSKVQYEYDAAYEGAYLTKQTSGNTEKVFDYDLETGNLTIEMTKNNSGANGSEVPLTTFYTYDYLNRITKMTYPDNSTKDFVYSDSTTSDRTIEVHDRTSSSGSEPSFYKIYEYDLRGDLITESHAGSSMSKTLVKSYEYDCFGNLISMKDGNLNQVKWSYDSANRPVRKEYVNPGGENDTVTLDYKNSNSDLGYETIENIDDIASGGRFNVFLKEDATVWAFGANDYYQLGNTGNYKITPQQINGLGTIKKLAAGKDWALALDSLGRVAAWGRNTEGHLGRGSISYGSPIPEYVTGLLNKKIIAIAAGNGHSLALQDNGTVWAWGYGEKGQLGNGTNLKENATPVQVLISGTNSALTGVVAIACGNNTSYALTSGGDLYAWGQNTSGQLCDGTTTNANKAKKVTNTAIAGKAKKIAAGHNSVMVILNDYKLLGWGENNYGQVYYKRNGADLTITTPTSYNDSTDNADIVAGKYNYYITKFDGSLVTTGKNHFAGIDREVTQNDITERVMDGISGVKKVSAGIDMAMVLSDNSSSATIFGRKGWQSERRANWDYPFMYDISIPYENPTNCAGTLTVTNENGSQTKVYYDVNSKIIREEKTNWNPFMLINTKYEYDFRGNLTKIIDPNQNQTNFLYDNFGRLYQKTDALGNVTTHTYTADDKLERMDEPGGKSTIYRYTNDGRVSEQKVGQSSEISNKWDFTRYFYDKSGNVIKTELGQQENSTETVLKETLYSYDSLNQLVATQTKLSNGVYDKVEYQYEPRGNIKYEKHYGNDSGSQRIEKSYLYDDQENVIQVVQSATYDNVLQGRQVVKYERDNVGNILKQKVKNGGNPTNETNMTTLDTTYTYDYRNRMTKLSEPIGEAGSNNTKTTSYAYDKVGNLVSKTISKSGVEIKEQYEYNVLNNMISKKVTSGIDVVRELYDYDHNGNLIRKYDARNQGIESHVIGNSNTFDYMGYEYDALNRRIKTVYHNDVLEFLQYDSRGNVTLRADGEGYLASNPSGSVGDRFAYDVKNNVISYIPADDASKVTSYTYDALGNQISKTDFYGNRTDYEYYGNGLIKTVRYGEVTETFAYDKTGLLRREQTDKNGNTMKVYYDIFGNPYKTEYPDGTTQTTGYCTYLGLALIVSKRKKQEEDAALGAVTYEYDRAGNIVKSKKLMLVEGDQGDQKIYSVKTMTYDELGNLLSITSSEQNETEGNVTNSPLNDTITYSYDMFNRVTKMTGPQGRETVNTYDKNGNITEAKSKISNGVYSVVSYEYDGQNRLSSKSIPLDIEDVFRQNDNVTDAVATTSYTYYKNNNIKTMTDPNGGVASYEYNRAGKLTKGISPTNDITLYSYDLNGNLVQETNGNGKVTNYEYDRFSNLIKKTEPDGAQTKYQYDHNGNLTKMILPNQTDTGSIITYDAMNRKVSVTDADQNVIQNYTYSSRGNLSAIYNGSNLLCFTYEYDQDDHLIKETDYSGHAVSYQYDILGNMTSKTDANGNITNYQFYPDSTLKQVSFPDGGQIDYTYDGLGRKISEAQKINGSTTATTTYQYNWAGQVKSVTDADSAVKKYYYDRNGNLTKYTLNNDIVATYVYDASNRMTQQNTPVDETLTNIQNITYDGVGNVLTKTVTDGTSEGTRGMTYTYYDSGQVYTVSENGVLMTKYYYDLNKNLTRLEQTRNANSTDTIDYEYDNNNRVTKEKRYVDTAAIMDENATPADGKVISQKQYRYDVYGNVTKVVEPNNAVKEYCYDRLNRLTTELFSYDTSSRNKKTYQYDGAGNIIAMSEVGQSIQTQTNQAGDSNYLQNTYTSEALRTTSYEYDQMNRMTKMTDPLENAVTYTYDFAGNQTSVTNALGTTTYTFDVLCRLKTVTDPFNRVISTKEYDKRGNLISNTDGNNKKTEYSYNKVGNMTRVKQPAGNMVDYTYNAFGECVQMIDGENNTTAYAYDAFGNLIGVTDPLGIETTYSYDYAKNMTAMTDGNGHTTEYQYASMNLMTGTTDAEGNTKHYRYDLTGNVAQIIDEAGNETNYRYDKRGYLISRKYEEENAVSYAFDYFGNRISMTDGTGESTYIFDLLGRVTQVRKDGFNQLAYTYDEVGNVLSVTDSTGNETVYTYDAMSRLATVTAAGETTSYTYDNAGNRTLTSYGNDATVSYTYDANNRVSKVENKNGDGSTISRYDYTYDGNNKILTKQFDNDSDRVERYIYDAAGRVETYQGLNGTKEYFYDGAGNRTGLYQHNNQEMYSGYEDEQHQPINYVDQYVSYTYSDSNKLLSQRTSMRDEDGLEVVATNQSSTYDEKGNLTKEETYVKLEGETNNRRQAEELTEKEELGEEKTTESTPSASPSAGPTTKPAESTEPISTPVASTEPTPTAESQSDVELGDIQQEEIQSVATSEPEDEAEQETVTESEPAQPATEPKPSATTSAEPTAEPVTEPVEPTENTEHTPVAEPSTEPSTEPTAEPTPSATPKEEKEAAPARQTMTEVGSRAIVLAIIAGLEELEGAEKVSETSYIYDGYNRLTSVTVDGTETSYQYDGDDVRVATIKGDITIRHEYAGGYIIAQRMTEGEEQKTITYARGLEYISRQSGGSLSYYFYNAHGDVVQTANEDGTIENRYEYDIFGETTLCIEEYDNPFRYSGEYHDSETGNIYLRARYYNPETARFLTQDSYLGQAATPATLNRYTYCANDPVNYVDPSGHLYEGPEWEAYVEENQYNPDAFEWEIINNITIHQTPMSQIDHESDILYAEKYGMTLTDYRFMKRFAKTYGGGILEFSDIYRLSESSDTKDVMKAEAFVYSAMAMPDAQDDNSMINRFIGYYVDRRGGINQSRGEQEVYQMLDDCASGWNRMKDGGFTFDEAQANMYDDYKFSIFDALGWMMLTGGDVNFVLIIRGLNNNVQPGTEARQEHFDIVEDMQVNMISKFVDAYALLTQVGENVDLPQFFVGATEDYGAKNEGEPVDAKTGLTERQSKDLELSMVMYANVKGRVAEKMSDSKVEGSMIAGFYYSNEGGVDGAFSKEFSTTFKQGFEGDQTIWVPFRDDATKDSMDQAIKDNIFDIVIIQPGMYFRDVEKTFYSDEGGTITNVVQKDLIDHAKTLAEDIKNLKNSVTKTKVGVQFEYDMGLVTGRQINKNEGGTTPEQKQFLFGMYVTYFGEFLGDPSVVIGIYSGGPNEQGMRDFSQNYNSLNLGNHVPHQYQTDTQDNYHSSMRFDSFNMRYGRYGGNPIYDISRNLIYQESGNRIQEWEKIKERFSKQREDE